jgi:hypothetical protein
LDSLNFVGNTTGYQSTGCTGTSTNNTFNIVISSGGTTALQTQFAPFFAILSAQCTSLTVNGITVNTVAQTITVGGNDYLITGATNCFTPL